MAKMKEEDKKRLSNTESTPKDEPKTDLPMSERDEEKEAEARTQKLAAKAQKTNFKNK